MDNIISFVSSGRFVKKRIWFGGCSGIAVGPEGAAGAGAERYTVQIKDTVKGK